MGLTRGGDTGRRSQAVYKREANVKRLQLVVGVLAAIFFAPVDAMSAPDDSTALRAVEPYMAVPMPAGFHVEQSELEGPVFADAQGRTLYIWPLKHLRNGYSGEREGIPSCYDTVQTRTAGLMSPYPPGILLPALDRRPSCTDLWPPVLADASAEPVGAWTILERKDGTRQWAYDGQPLYTSIKDREPGDTIGGTTRNGGGSGAPAIRAPAGPPTMLPPGFGVTTTSIGRLLTTDRNYSVYSYDKDTADQSMCQGDCTRTWQPILASQMAHVPESGGWSLLERAPGVYQWAFRGKPLYTYAFDLKQRSFEGGDVPGWSNVFLQNAPAPPASFTVQDTIQGQVLADHRGMTIYTYKCGDDSIDQLSCEHPDDIQAYRWAMCGGGDPAICLQEWPYVLADEGAEATSRAWSIMLIDPKTGHRAEPGQEDALRVWAYRDRPVYTYSGDREPGAISGDSNGVWRGMRNGFRAFWLRDPFFGHNR